jgi:adhesin transport system outer membrane protein
MQINKLLLLLIFSIFTSTSIAHTFNEAISVALQFNPSVLGKTAEVRASEFGLSSAKAQRLPSVSTFVSEMNDDYNQGILTIDQPLYSFGRISADIDRAQAQIEVNDADLLLVKREIAERTGHSYNDLYYAKKIAELGLLNIAEHEKLLDHIQRRLDGELASEADVGLGRSRLTNAKIQQRRYKRGIEVARSTMQSLTVNYVDAVKPVPHEQWITELQHPNVFRNMFEHDALLMQKASNIDLSKAEVETNETVNLPTLKLRAEHNFLDDPIRGDNNRIGLILESTFNGLGYIGAGRVDASKQRLIAAERDFDSTEAELERQLQMLIEDFTANTVMLEEQTQAVELVKNTFESYFRQYRAGRKSWIDLLNIQRELTEQRVQQLELERALVNVSISMASRLGLLSETKAEN